MNAPRVSIITIFRDEERHLAAAVASVAAQTMPDWELLLVDDGSTDGSAAIAARLAATEPRIRCLAHPGGAALGTSASRNLGIREARAPLVAFLDADDLYLPMRLARHLALLDADPSIDVVQSDAIHWIAPRDDHDAAAEHRQRQGLWEDGAIIVPPEGLAVLLTVPALHVFTCDLTIRRALLERIGGFEDAFGGTHEDLVLFAKLYRVARVAVVGEFLAKVRRSAGSSTYLAQREAHRPEGVYQRDARAYRAWLGGFLRDSRIDDPLVLALLARREAGSAGLRRRGWFIKLRASAFDLLARLAPRALYLATVRGYRTVVRYHARRRFAALHAEARRLGLGWAR